MCDIRLPFEYVLNDLVENSINIYLRQFNIHSCWWCNMLSMRREAALGTFTYITFYVSRERIWTYIRRTRECFCSVSTDGVDCNAKRHYDYVVYHYFKLWFYLRHINVHRTHADVVFGQCVRVTLDQPTSIFSFNITYSPIELIASMQFRLFAPYYMSFHQMPGIFLTNAKKVEETCRM